MTMEGTQLHVQTVFGGLVKERKPKGKENFAGSNQIGEITG